MVVLLVTFFLTVFVDLVIAIESGLCFQPCIDEAVQRSCMRPKAENDNEERQMSGKHFSMRNFLQS